MKSIPFCLRPSDGSGTLRMHQNASNTPKTDISIFKGGREVARAVIANGNDPISEVWITSDIPFALVNDRNGRKSDEIDLIADYNELESNTAEHVRKRNLDSGKLFEIKLEPGMIDNDVVPKIIGKVMVVDLVEKKKEDDDSGQVEQIEILKVKRRRAVSADIEDSVAVAKKVKKDV